MRKIFHFLTTSAVVLFGFLSPGYQEVLAQTGESHDATVLQDKEEKEIGWKEGSPTSF